MIRNIISVVLTEQFLRTDKITFQGAETSYSKSNMRRPLSTKNARIPYYCKSTNGLSAKQHENLLTEFDLICCRPNAFENIYFFKFKILLRD